MTRPFAWSYAQLLEPVGLTPGVAHLSELSDRLPASLVGGAAVG